MNIENPVQLCLVEDDPIMGESLCFRFELEGFKCDWYKTALAAKPQICKKNYSVLISDIRLPDMNGMDLYTLLLDEGHTIPPTIFITGHGSINDAVELLKKGAADYITKPFDLDVLIEKILSVCLQHKTTDSKSQPTLGISAAMRSIEQMLCRVSRHGSTVLITGESGVGKEHAALFLHNCANRDMEKPFVAVNCGAIPEGLIESELFGHEKGAFTGAMRTKKGFFEQANNGTLFLDEIGEMPPNMQVRLLRVIQNMQIVRIGGEKPIPLKIRLICATNRDLKQMVANGSFREDLYYRINVVHISIPPLRERREDILWFIRMFFNELEPDSKHYLHPSAEELLLHYNWPGNLRELHHNIERACILSSKSEIDAVIFKEILEDQFGTKITAHNLKERLGNYEQQLIIEALEHHDYQINETAAELEISRKNLWEKMKKYDINKTS